MNDDLTTRLSRQLHEQVDDWHTTPLTLDGVRGRATSIRRTRRVLAGGAMVAVLAIAAPLAVTAAGGLDAGPDRPVGPATNAPSEAVVPTPKADGTFPLTLDLATGEVPASGYLAFDAQQLVTPDQTYDLPGRFVQVAPYDGGWVGIRGGDFRPTGHQVVVLDAELQEVSVTPSAPSLVTSDDGGRVAWVEAGTGDADWVLVNAPVTPADGGDAIRTPVPPETVPEGFLADDRVAFSTTDPRTGDRSYGMAGPGGTAGTPALQGYQRVGGISQTAGLAAGQTEFNGDSTCSEVRATPTDDTPVAGTCRHQLGSFSPDGSLLIGMASYYDYASPTLAILDARTGEPVVEWTSSARPEASAMVQSAVWDDEDTVLAVVEQGARQAVVRFEVDGSAVRVSEPLEASMSIEYFLPSHPYGQ